ncbi:MAG: bacteriohemerythrin [Negativicutes bacterium]|nr:bacteriohemerythrin [Negativicutes bacterium]
MNRLDNLTLGKKLLVPFVVVVIGFAAIFTVNTYFAGKSEERQNQLVDEGISVLNSIDKLTYNAVKNESAIFQVLVSQNAGKKKELQDGIDARTRETNQIYEQLNQAIADPEEKDLLQQAWAAREAYRQARVGFASRQSVSSAAMIEAFSSDVQPKQEVYLQKLNLLRDKVLARAAFLDQENDRMYRLETKIKIAVLLVVLAVVVVISWLIRRSLATPLADTRHAFVEMSKGNFAVGNEVRHISRRDEIGDMVRALQDMRSTLKDIFQRIIMAADQVASASENLSSTSHEAAQASNQVAEAVTDIAGGIDRQSAAMSESSHIVEQNSASLEEVAATANFVSASSAQMVEDANEGGRAAETAIRQMNSIQVAVDNLSVVINKLGEQSQSIGQIVNTIASISAQTNLLALNAAIEAARAGEQGRGFAVVAEEVRKLAEQSQEAAKQISTLIVEIQSDTDKAVSAMAAGAQEVKTGSEVVNSAGQKFRSIAEAINNVNQQMREISASVEEMASGSQRMVNSIKETESVSRGIAQQAQTVSAATEETSASMEEIASASRSLSAIAADMQEAVTSFAGSLLMNTSKQTEGQLKLTDDLRTGVSRMDGQHGKLIDYINQLYQALQKARQAGRGDEGLKKLVRDVAAYADEHLAQEEQLMRQHSYPGYDEQYKAHEYYRQRVRAALAQLNATPIEASESVYRFLNGWLVAHIANIDTKYGPFFKGRGVN